jgi:hypothetical protein
MDDNITTTGASNIYICLDPIGYHQLLVACRATHATPLPILLDGPRRTHRPSQVKLPVVQGERRRQQPTAKKRKKTNLRRLKSNASNGFQITDQ